MELPSRHGASLSTGQLCLAHAHEAKTAKSSPMSLIVKAGDCGNHDENDDDDREVSTNDSSLAKDKQTSRRDDAIYRRWKRWGS